MYTDSFWTKVLIFLSSFVSTMSIIFYTLLIFKDRCGFMYDRRMTQQIFRLQGKGFICVVWDKRMTRQ